MRLPLTLLFLMPVLALAAIYWKVQDDKFPYAGTWVDYPKPVNGPRAKLTVTFDRDGKLSVSMTDKGRTNAYACSYTMQGANALILVKSGTTQREGKTCSTFVQASLVPQQNGDVLLHYTLKWWIAEQKTGKVVAENNYKPDRPLYTLRRVPT